MIFNIVIALVIFKVIMFIYNKLVGDDIRWLRKINRKLKSKIITWLLR